MPPKFAVEEPSNFMIHCSLITSAVATSPRLHRPMEIPLRLEIGLASLLWPDFLPPWVFLPSSHIVAIVTTTKISFRKE